MRPLLADDARRWWDAHPATLEAGIAGAGRLERYIGAFRDRLPALVAPGTVDRVLACDDRRARRALVDGALCTPAFVAAFRAHFSRARMSAEGRSAAQFAHVGPVDVAGWFLARLRWALGELPVRGNPYVERFLRGGVRDLDAATPWLRPANHARLRALAPRVAVVTAPLDAWLAARPAAALGGAACSDLFEYLAPADADALFAALARALRPGARLAYWNLLVPRASPDALRAPRGPLRHLDRLSHALWRRDRAWFYGAFHVEEVHAR